jgi:hypothetical protein
MTYPPDADQLLATLRNGAWLDAQEFPPLTYAVPAFRCIIRLDGALIDTAAVKTFVGTT